MSTDGQTLDAQQAELRQAGVEKVYSEKISGAVSDRPALAKAIGGLGNGDTLIVTKLDRLARSTRDLLNTLAAIAAAGASFKSLGDQWADTTTPHDRLMLTVLGGLAEFERHLILARTSEGRQRAQARGVRFGRKPKLTLHQQQEALARRSAGEALRDPTQSRTQLSHVSRNEVGQTGVVRDPQSGPFTTTGRPPSGYGYAISNLTFQPPNKSGSYCQLALGNNQSRSSNALTSATNSDGNSLETW